MAKKRFTIILCAKYNSNIFRGEFECVGIGVTFILGDAIELAAFLTYFCNYFCKKEKLLLDQYCYVVEGNFLGEDTRKS